MNKKLVLPVVILLVLMGGLIVKLTILKEPFVYTGTIEATKVDISSRVSSVISQISVEQGDEVKLGQWLLKMSCEDIALEARLAQSNYDRSLNLYKQGSQPREAYEQNQNRRDTALLRLSWCDVNAPLSGTVLSKYHQPGEMVNPGTKLFTLADVKHVYAYIYVPQPDVAQLKLKQKLVGFLPELDNQQFEGVITEIGEQAEFTPKNVQTRKERQRLVYAVKVSFDNPQNILKPGMSIEIRPPNE